MEMEDEHALREEMNERVIENYRHDEQMMVLIFAQWAVNNEVNAVEMYEEAYPEQIKNNTLIEALEQTVPKGEADHIDDGVVLNVLEIFGNSDLAFIVQETIDNRHNSSEER